MNCRQIESVLSAFVDGELPAQQYGEITAHLDSCPQCRQRLAAMKEIDDGIAALPQLQPEPQFLADVRRKIRAAAEPASQPSWIDLLFRPAWIKVPLEAVALVAIMVGVFVLLPHRQEQAVQLSQLEADRLDGRRFNIAIEAPEKTELPASPANRDETRSQLDGAKDQLRETSDAEIAMKEAAQDSVGNTLPSASPSPSEPIVTASSETAPALVAQVGLAGKGLDSFDKKQEETAKALEQRQQSNRMETIIIASADVSIVEQQALGVAQGLNGNVYTLKQVVPAKRSASESNRSVPAVQSIFVQVPVANAEKFKTQLASMSAGKSTATVAGSVTPASLAAARLEELKKTKEASAKSGSSNVPAVHLSPAAQLVLNWAERPSSTQQVQAAGGGAQSEIDSPGLRDLKRMAETMLIEIQVVPPGR